MSSSVRQILDGFLARELPLRDNEVPNFEPLRNLYNRLSQDYPLLPREDLVVAFTLIQVLHQVFLNFAMDSPWDSKRILTQKRKEIHSSVYNFLRSCGSSEANFDTVWQSLTEFLQKFNGALDEIEAEDRKSLIISDSAGPLK